MPLIISAYFLIGSVFGLYFLIRGFRQLDSSAATAGIPVRLLWLPAAILLWPVLGRRLVFNKASKSGTNARRNGSWRNLIVGCIAWSGFYCCRPCWASCILRSNLNQQKHPASIQRHTPARQENYHESRLCVRSVESQQGNLWPHPVVGHYPLHRHFCDD